MGEARTRPRDGGQYGGYLRNRLAMEIRQSGRHSIILNELLPMRRTPVKCILTPRRSSQLGHATSGTNFRASAS